MLYFWKGDGPPIFQPIFHRFPPLIFPPTLHQFFTDCSAEFSTNFPPTFSPIFVPILCWFFHRFLCWFSHRFFQQFFPAIFPPIFLPIFPPIFVRIFSTDSNLILPCPQLFHFLCVHCGVYCCLVLEKYWWRVSPIVPFYCSIYTSRCYIHLRWSCWKDQWDTSIWNLISLVATWVSWCTFYSSHGILSTFAKFHLQPLWKTNVSSAFGFLLFSTNKWISSCCIISRKLMDWPTNWFPTALV